MNLTQPYDHIVVDEWQSWTAARGIELLMPPDPLASFWYPGSTLFIVLAAPGTEVQWLPEQDGRLAHMWQPRVGEHVDQLTTKEQMQTKSECARRRLKLSVILVGGVLKSRRAGHRQVTEPPS